MRLVVHDIGDPEVGIWGGDISCDFDGLHIDDVEERKDIEEGFRKFLRDFDLVQNMGDSHWEMSF